MGDCLEIIPCEDVGILAIRDLTRDELIECVEAACRHNSSAQFWVRREIIYIADKRRKKKLEADEAKGEKWIRLQKEYADMLRPYAGKKIGELPAEVIEKGAKLERAIQKAQKEYFATFESGV